MNRNLLLLPLFVFLTVCAAKAQNNDVAGLPTIQVIGTAEIQVVPDTATLSFTVAEKNQSVAVAKKQNDARIAKVTELAKRFDIAATDVKTDYINVGAATRREKLRGSDSEYTDVPDGFTVSRNLVVKLRDISRFESFLTALLDAGINDVSSVAFTSSELRKYKDQARAQAIRAAKEKAQSLAKEINQTVGKAVSVKENNVESYRSAATNISQNSFSTEGGEAAETVSVGAISVRAQIEVKFLLN